MYKNRRIIAGIIIFVALLAIPFLYNWGKSNQGPGLNLNSGAANQLTDNQCVEPPVWMSANHMKLLAQWRNEFVRDGKTVYVNSQGKSFKIGIDTCLKCHYNPALSPSQQFCVKCHDYVSVQPTCWTCHPWPTGTAK